MHDHPSFIPAIFPLRAEASLKTCAGKRFGATSFALMRSRKIREALAFDGDFSAAGFVELRP
jgi:hypothetical protein